METLFGVIVGLIALTVLVVLHELGHGLVARRNKVVVEEFGVGFPPKAWAKKLKKSILGKNVLYSVNWLPLGGFVKLKGEYDSASKEGDYGAASYWVKTKILLAGVFINWITAAVLLTILAVTGMPQVIAGQFSVPSDTKVVHKDVRLGALSHGFPAEKAGLKGKDAIKSINGKTVETSQQFIDYTHQFAGQTVNIDYVRDGQNKTVKVPLLKANSNKDNIVFGATLTQPQETRSTWSAPIVGVATTGQFTWETFKGLGSMVYNLVNGVVSQFSSDQATKEKGSAEVAEATNNVAGPLGILAIIFPAGVAGGLTLLVFLIANISLALAIMNVLPIPALDGGRWFTMTIYRLMKRPLTKEREEKIQTAGFLALMALVVLVTVADVGKFTQ